MKNFTLILPMFNDWESLNILIERIENILKKTKYHFSVIIIDDKSTEKNIYSLNKNSYFKDIKILKLKKNIGSQKAIATALKYISDNSENFDDKFIIMDSDGEDDPNKLLDLFNALEKNHNIKIATFNRTLRKESLLFSILYEVHLFITFLFTFNYIRFGNFSFITLDIIKKVVTKEELWFAYSATLNKYFDKKFKISAPRKKRISGHSKMSYMNLIKHSINIQIVNKKNLIFSYSFYLFILLTLKPIILINIFYLFLAIFLIHFLLIGFFLRDTYKNISFRNCLNNIESIKNI